MRWFPLFLVLVLGCSRRDQTHPTTGAVPHIGKHESFMARHEAILAEGRSEKFDIIYLGDSMTWGWDEHRELWKQEVTPKSTAFWAIGGDATNQLLWRIVHGELDAQSPRLILLMIGTNNRSVQDDTDDIARSIDSVVQAIQAKCPKAKVLLLGILPQGYAATEGSRKRFAEVNQKLPAIAKTRGVIFHDLGQVFLESDGSLSIAVSYDGTHLTTLGYQQLAKALGPIVRELVKKLESSLHTP